MVIRHLIFSCLIAYIATIFVVILVRPVAIRIGLIDLPSHRKFHQGKIPIIGGIAMLFGLSIGLLVLSMSLVTYRSLLASAAILVFVGVLDDLHELTARARIYAQIFVAFLIIFVGKAVVNNLGNLLLMGPIHLGALGVPFSIIAVIGIINCINMVDGVDGLAGSIVVIQLIYLAILAFMAHHLNDFMFILVCVAPVLGFLTFNLQLKKNAYNIFMGDAGTMLLGILLSWFLMSLSQPPHQAAPPVAFLWIVALPLFDMVHVVLRRVRRKISPIRADRQHLHHMLQYYRFNNRLVVLIMSILSVGFGLVGLLITIFHWSESLMFIILLLLFVFYCFLFNIFYPIRKNA